jgi:glutathione-independent formaldehyde dehydrogenase
VVNPTGHIGVVYFPEDPGGVDEQAKKGILKVAWGKLFGKGLTIGCGQTSVKKYNAYLRDLIIAKRAKPSRIISRRVPIEGAPEAYRKFDDSIHQSGTGKSELTHLAHTSGKHRIEGL